MTRLNDAVVLALEIFPPPKRAFTNNFEVGHPLFFILFLIPEDRAEVAKKARAQ